jgi:hypothetical protein|tara:strand:+ start:4505 stop:5023 length:519 start_codon:yes stop_codon:yes gene_type:complete
LARRHPIWYGIGFSIIPFFVLLLGYINIHPEIFRSIPSDFGARVSAPSVRIDWDENDAEDPPLEYVSDSFSGMEVWTTVVEVNSFWSLWNRPLSEVEYQWDYTVKNLTSDSRDIKVAYRLENSAEKVLASSNGSVTAEPGETVVINGVHRLPYFDAGQVVGSGWTIRHSVER